MVKLVRNVALHLCLRTLLSFLDLTVDVYLCITDGSRANDVRKSTTTKPSLSTGAAPLSGTLLVRGSRGFSIQVPRLIERKLVGDTDCGNNSPRLQPVHRPRAYRGSDQRLQVTLNPRITHSSVMWFLTVGRSARRETR